MRGCRHKKVKAGPRYPLRYGSSPTEVCCSCEAWRTTFFYADPSPWEPGPIEDAIKAIDSEDER